MPILPLTRRESFFVLDGVVRPVIDEELPHLTAGVEGHREVQRGISGGVGVVDVGAAPDQKLHDGHLPQTRQAAKEGTNG